MKKTTSQCLNAPAPRAIPGTYATPGPTPAPQTPATTTPYATTSSPPETHLSTTSSASAHPSSAPTQKPASTAPSTPASFHPASTTPHARPPLNSSKSTTSRPLSSQISSASVPRATSATSAKRRLPHALQTLARTVVDAHQAVSMTPSHVAAILLSPENFASICLTNVPVFLVEMAPHVCRRLKARNASALLILVGPTAMFLRDRVIQ